MAPVMYFAPRIDVEELIADLEPGETVEYMGEVWGSCPVEDHSPRPTEAEEASTGDADPGAMSPAARVPELTGASQPRARAASASR